MVHLMFVGDIKVYISNESTLGQSLKVAQRIAIGMNVGLPQQALRKARLPRL